MSSEILEFTIADYEAAFALWESCEGIGLSDADSRDAIQRYLQRNPGLSFVAKRNGKLVGALLSGHDGRRGYMHHLAVNESARRQGVGGRLVGASLDALKKLGIQKCHIFIFRNNTEGLSFWKSLGWEQRGDIAIISKDIVCCRSKCSC